MDYHAELMKPVQTATTFFPFWTNRPHALTIASKLHVSKGTSPKISFNQLSFFKKVRFLEDFKQIKYCCEKYYVKILDVVGYHQNQQ